jgi:membrane-associated phospholipid phosphatase
VDVSWFLTINRFARETPWLHPVLAGYAAFGVVLFAALLMLGWWHARRSGRAMTAAVWAPLGVLLAVAVNQPIVALFAEPRPYTHLSGVLVLVARSTDPSFPSDHATMAGAVAAGLWRVDRRLSLFAAAAALLMAFARVYVGAHYPRDVLAGLALGAVVSIVGYAVAAPVLRRLLAWVRRTRLRSLVQPVSHRP